VTLQPTPLYPALHRPPVLSGIKTLALFVGIPVLLLFGPSLIMFIIDKYKELWARMRGRAHSMPHSNATYSTATTTAFVMPLTTHAAYAAPSGVALATTETPSQATAGRADDMYSYWR
jgi:hypothetical protein